MKKYKSMIIGHVTMDRNEDHLGNVQKLEGGAVLYSSAAAYALGHKVCVLTKMAKEDCGRLKAFTLPAEDIFCVNADSSTDMVNIYLTADKERRKSTCPRRGDPFVLDDIPKNLDITIYHLAGLLYGDYDNNLIAELSRRGKVAVDVQGYLRHADPKDGHMYFEDWAEKKKLLPYITYLKTDAAEAEILTGLTDRAEAAKLLYSWGAKEVIITHNSEVLVYDGNKIYTCPIKARDLCGRTGRGDTTFAVYINERENTGIEQSLLWATATVSVKMETVGPYKGNREEVQSYINKYYR